MWLCVETVRLEVGVKERKGGEEHDDVQNHESKERCAYAGEEDISYVL